MVFCINKVQTVKRKER